MNRKETTLVFILFPLIPAVRIVLLLYSHLLAFPRLDLACLVLLVFYYDLYLVFFLPLSLPLFFDFAIEICQQIVNYVNLRFRAYDLIAH